MSRLSVPALLTLLAAAPPAVRGGDDFDLYEAKIVLEVPTKHLLPAGLLGEGELQVEVLHHWKRIQPYIVINGKDLPSGITVEEVAPRETRFVWTGGLLMKTEAVPASQEPKGADGVDLWEQRTTNLKGITKP
jgi:hypothetical protein